MLQKDSRIRGAGNIADFTVSGKGGKPNTFQQLLFPRILPAVFVSGRGIAGDAYFQFDTKVAMLDGSRVAVNPPLDTAASLP
jgi:hypothetical protein